MSNGQDIKVECSSGPIAFNEDVLLLEVSVCENRVMVPNHQREEAAVKLRLPAEVDCH